MEGKKRGHRWEILGLELRRLTAKSEPLATDTTGEGGNSAPHLIRKRGGPHPCDRGATN